MSTRFAFEFTALSPDLANPTNSLNDVLRLTNAAPFDLNLVTQNTVSVYLNMTGVGGTYRGGFYADQLTPASLLAAVQNAGYAYYVKDPAGTTTFKGVSYSSLDTVKHPVTLGVAGVSSGAITAFFVSHGPGTLIIVR